jgi:hypothetical protein
LAHRGGVPDSPLENGAGVLDVFDIRSEKAVAGVGQWPESAPPGRSDKPWQSLVQQQHIAQRQSMLWEVRCGVEVVVDQVMQAVRPEAPSVSRIGQAYRQVA